MAKIPNVIAGVVVLTGYTGTGIISATLSKRLNSMAGSALEDAYPEEYVFGSQYDLSLEVYADTTNDDELFTVADEVLATFKASGATTLGSTLFSGTCIVQQLGAAVRQGDFLKYSAQLRSTGTPLVG